MPSTDREKVGALFVPEIFSRGMQFTKKNLCSTRSSTHQCLSNRVLIEL